MIGLLQEMVRVDVACNVAFKEWVVICRALTQGRQRVILRKGGIVEPGSGFRLEHRAFLLTPTFLHQSAESIIPAAGDLFIDIDANRPPKGTAVLRHRTSVTRSSRITALADLALYRDDHVWSDAVVAERFHRGGDGIEVFKVGVAALPELLVVPWQESFGGCKSWVDLAG